MHIECAVAGYIGVLTQLNNARTSLIKCSSAPHAPHTRSQDDLDELMSSSPNPQQNSRTVALLSSLSRVCELVFNFNTCSCFSIVFAFCDHEA